MHTLLTRSLRLDFITLLSSSRQPPAAAGPAAPRPHSAPCHVGTQRQLDRYMRAQSRARGDEIQFDESPRRTVIQTSHSCCLTTRSKPGLVLSSSIRKVLVATHRTLLSSGGYQALCTVVAVHTGQQREEHQEKLRSTKRRL